MTIDSDNSIGLIEVGCGGRAPRSSLGAAYWDEVRRIHQRSRRWQAIVVRAFRCRQSVDGLSVATLQDRSTSSSPRVRDRRCLSAMAAGKNPSPTLWPPYRRSRTTSPPSLCSAPPLCLLSFSVRHRTPGPIAARHVHFLAPRVMDSASTPSLFFSV